jgi:hypothetical protein
MMLTELIDSLTALHAAHGDAPVVLGDVEGQLHALLALDEDGEPAPAGAPADSIVLLSEDAAA